MTSGGERDYWETRLGEHFTLDGVGYLGLGKSFNAWMYRVRRVIVMRRLRSLPKELATLDALDVGSGTGFYIDLWRRLGVRSVTGSDITEKAVDELSARYPSNRFVRLDIGAEENPLAEGGFDVATAFDVLFHIVDDERYRRAFRNIAHALKPGGLLVFTDNFVHGSTASSSTQSSRTVSDIEEAVRSAGFEVVERRPSFVLMNAPIDSRSRALHSWWQLLTRGAAASDAFGWIAGAVLCPIEIALCSILRDGPSTEMMVCRRAASGD